MTIPLTVALTTYNRSHYLKESLSAILNQTYRDFELLVLDNGSIDDTTQVVLSFKDDRLRYIRNAPGYTSIFNSLSAQWIARGDRLLITHDDDIMEPDMLERQMELIAARPDLVAVWTNKSVIDKNGNMVQPWFTPPGDTRIFERGEFIARTAEERVWHPAGCMIFSPHLLSTSALFRSYRGVSGIANDLRERPDITGGWDLIRPALMNLKGPVAFINAPLLRYRQHATQDTHSSHLTHTVLYSFQRLRSLVRKTSFREEYEPVFNAQIARYKAQDLVAHTERPEFNRTQIRRLIGLLNKGAAGITANPGVGHALLPLIITLMQVGADESTGKVLDELVAPGEQAARSIRSLYAWVEHRRAGGNIFAGLSPQSNIVILGSVHVSALLIKEAHEAGINVVCCLDSNVTRQGCMLLGVPIVSPSWLKNHSERLDLIVLSSERDHEEKLEEFIRRHDAITPVVSWKGVIEVVPTFSGALSKELAKQIGALI